MATFQDYIEDPKSGRIPVVTKDGTVGTIPSHEFDEKIYRVATREEVDKKILDDNSSGTLGAIKAGAAGLARGATLGLSDLLLTHDWTGPLVSNIPKQFPGNQPERRLVEPETLRALEENQPEASITGEVGGNILPLLLSGGGTGVTGALGKGVRFLGSPVRALAKSGQLLEQELASGVGRKFLTEGMEAGLKKTALTTLPKAVSMGAEGAAYGLQQSLTDMALERKEVTAENLMAGAGMGSLFGASIPVGLAGGSILGRLAGRAATKSLTSLGEKIASLPAVQGTVNWTLTQSKKLGMDVVDVGKTGAGELADAAIGTVSGVVGAGIGAVSGAVVGGLVTGGAASLLDGQSDGGWNAVAGWVGSGVGGVAGTVIGAAAGAGIGAGLRKGTANPAVVKKAGDYLSRSYSTLGSFVGDAKKETLRQATRGFGTPEGPGIRARILSTDEEVEKMAQSIYDDLAKTQDEVVKARKQMNLPVEDSKTFAFGSGKKTGSGKGGPYGPWTGPEDPEITLMSRGWRWADDEHKFLSPKELKEYREWMAWQEKIIAQDQAISFKPGTKIKPWSAKPSVPPEQITEMENFIGGLDALLKKPDATLTSKAAAIDEAKKLGYWKARPDELAAIKREFNKLIGSTVSTDVTSKAGDKIFQTFKTRMESIVKGSKIKPIGSGKTIGGLGGQTMMGGQPVEVLNAGVVFDALSDVGVIRHRLSQSSDEYVRGVGEKLNASTTAFYDDFSKQLAKYLRDAPDVLPTAQPIPGVKEAVTLGSEAIRLGKKGAKAAIKGGIAIGISEAKGFGSIASGMPGLSAAIEFLHIDSWAKNKLFRLVDLSGDTMDSWLKRWADAHFSVDQRYTRNLMKTVRKAEKELLKHEERLSGTGLWEKLKSRILGKKKPVDLDTLIDAMEGRVDDATQADFMERMIPELRADMDSLAAQIANPVEGADLSKLQDDLKHFKDWHDLMSGSLGKLDPEAAKRAAAAPASRTVRPDEVSKYREMLANHLENPLFYGDAAEDHRALYKVLYPLDRSVGALEGKLMENGKFSVEKVRKYVREMSTGQGSEDEAKMITSFLTDYNGRVKGLVEEVEKRQVFTAEMNQATRKVLSTDGIQMPDPAVMKEFQKAVDQHIKNIPDLKVRGELKKLQKRGSLLYDLLFLSVGASLGGPSGFATAMGGRMLQNPLLAVRAMSLIEDFSGTAKRGMTKAVDDFVGRYKIPKQQPKGKKVGEGLEGLDFPPLDIAGLNPELRKYRKGRAVVVPLAFDILRQTSLWPEESYGERGDYGLDPLNAPGLPIKFYKERKDQQPLPASRKKQAEFLRISDELTKLVTNPGRAADLLSGATQGMAMFMPDKSEAIGQQGIRYLQFLFDRMPKNPQPENPFSGRQWVPSDMEIDKFARYLRAAESPFNTMEDLAAGRLTKEAVEATRELWPEKYGELQQQMLEALTDPEVRVPYRERVQMSMLLGIPVDRSTSPEYLRALQTKAANADEEKAGPRGGAKVNPPEIGTEINRVANSGLANK